MQIHMFVVGLATAALLSFGAAATTKVRAGDTLTGLAARHGTTVTALVRANPGLSAHRLQIGQTVVLPVGPARSSSGVTIRASSIRVNAVLPLQGRLTTPFNARHGGLDLAAPTGTPIRAALAGTVKSSVYDARNGWGWTVVLEHVNGLTSRYSHNSANLVRRGQQVSAGQVIARVGNTGNSTGPHLDFRVYAGGTPINPMGLF
ncbi:M23 family metallopeptidase [Deinococcus arcticus]|nr:LysM peptidoglycan-binding domain-containing M23 family metallopeptidase [Deinococcus arcticus]